MCCFTCSSYALLEVGADGAGDDVAGNRKIVLPKYIRAVTCPMPLIILYLIPFAFFSAFDNPELLEIKQLFITT